MDFGLQAVSGVIRAVAEEIQAVKAHLREHFAIIRAVMQFISYYATDIFRF